MTVPVFPIPAFVSAVLVFLVVRGLVARALPWPLALLMAVAAAQSALIAAIQMGHASGWARIAPITAGVIPALAWLGFEQIRRGGWRAGDVLHLLPWVALVAARLTAPMLIDATLIAIYLGYGAAMFWALARGADDLARARLSEGDRSVALWRGVAGLLVFSGLSDVLIAVDFARSGGAHVGWIVSVTSSVLLLGLGLLSGERAASAPEPELTPQEPASAGTPAPEITEEDTALMARLRDLLTGSRLYRDPELTLSRLARRLGVPVKALSAAINRVTGENVSRLINGYRVDDVCARLSAGEDVTGAMFAAGFQTKSNFNREFRRVTGQSPTEWRKAQGL